MPKFSDLYPSNYLKSSDLPVGEDVVLTITELRTETLGQGDDAQEKPILYFDPAEVGQAMGQENAKKGIVLNKTNGERIAKMYGDDYTLWRGCRVALCVEDVNFQGKMTPAIRVRANRSYPRATTPFQGSFAMQPDNPYGISASHSSPTPVGEGDLSAVVNVLNEAGGLKMVSEEVQKIRTMLKSAQEQCILRHITFDKNYTPKTIGDAVAWLKALLNACLDNDKAAAKSTQENIPF